MLKISQKVRYAVRALVRLDSFEDKSATLKQISFKENIPIKFLEQIFGALVKAEILASKRGVEGGYKLIKPLSEISLYDVMKALKEDVKLARCFDFTKYECPIAEKCKVESFWKEIQEKFLNILKESKLG